MRGRLINWRFVGPLLAVVAVVLVAVTTAFHLTRPNEVTTARHEDTMSRQLAACRAIGTDAASSPICLAAWKENRRRFFGEPQQRQTDAGAAETEKGATQP